MHKSSLTSEMEQILQACNLGPRSLGSALDPKLVSIYFTC